MEYSTREVTQYIRERLDIADNIRAGRDPMARRPKSEVLAERISGEIIPALKSVYLEMIATSVEWKQKGFQEALQNAVVKNELLAGFPATVWISWGELMLRLLDFVDTPQEDLGGVTAEDMLLADYIPMTKEQWAALNPPVVVDPVVTEEPAVVVPPVEDGGSQLLLPGN